MWLALIVSSALHGLVLLPVLLSLWGGQGASVSAALKTSPRCPTSVTDTHLARAGYALTTQDSDGGWIETSVQRRYERESRPFIDDDASSVGSDEY